MSDPSNPAETTSISSGWLQNAAAGLLVHVSSGWKEHGNTQSLIARVGESFENRRLLILQPFALILGILTNLQAKTEPSALVLLGVGLGLIALIVALRRTFYPLIGACLSAGFWVGFCLLSLHGALFGTPMMAYVSYGSYEATVDAIHSDDGERARLILSGLVPGEDAREIDIRRARILVPSDQAPNVGDRVRAQMRLYKVPGPVVPFGYDSQFHSYFAGIGAFGSATIEIEVIAPATGTGFSQVVQTTRAAIGNRINLVLTGQVRAISRALVIGDQGLIEDVVRAKMANAGLAHVLAISGLHLTLVAGGVFAFLRLVLAGFPLIGMNWAGRRWEIKKLAALGGMVVALAYLSISGASVSAIRATIMLMLVFGAVLVGRQALTMRNVAIAALIVILTSPAAILRPSFQLSFAAVVALIGVYELYRPHYGDGIGAGHRLFRFFAGLALTSIIAGLATALFAAFHFQQTAPFGVVGNIVVIPLVAFVVLPSALLGVISMPLGFEAIPLQTMGWGIEKILMVADFVSSFSQNVATPPLLSPTSLLIGMAALACLAFFSTALRFVGIVFCVPLIALFGLALPPDVMIADSTQAVAVRDDGQLGLIGGRTGSFAVNAWSESYMELIAASVEGRSCDQSGCFLASSQGFSVALVKTHDAFAEDCGLADLVVTKLYAPQTCARRTQVIDRLDLERRGVHWARWDGDAFILRPAITDELRPWRAQY